MFGPHSPQSVLFAGNRRRPRRRVVLPACLALVWATGAVIGCSSPQARYRVLSVFFDGVPNPDAQVTRTQSAQNDPTAVYRKPTNSVHKPFAANDCSACHTGGAEAAIGSSGSESVLDSDICMKCHQPIPTQFAVMHAPVAAKACLFCHDPHEASQPHLLKMPAPMLCTQCHDRSLLGKKPPEHLDEKMNCLECHTGHGGDHKFFVRQSHAPATQPSPHVDVQAQLGIDSPPWRGRPARASEASDLEATIVSGSEVAPHGRDAPATAEQTYAPATQPVVSADRPLTLVADVTPEPGGPVVIGEQRSTQFFHLDPIGTTLELRYRMENDKIDQNNGTSSRFTENRLEEDLTLKTNAYIVHPNLVDMKLSGTIGPRQDWFDSNGQSGYGREMVYDYDVSATMLRKEDAPVTLYSRSSTGVVNRQFAPSFDNTVTTSGGIVDWNSKTLPTRVEVYHTDQSQNAIDGTQAFSLSQNSANLHSEARPTSDQRLVLDYTFSDIQQTNKFSGTGAQTSNFDIDTALLSHTADFGANKQNNLSSSVSFFDQSGDFPLEHLRWDERLLLRHSPSFETRYQYALDYQSSQLTGFGTVDQLQQVGLAGFTHRLYRSLVTSGTLGVREFKQSGESAGNGYFANVNTDYHKEVPLGRLNVTAGYAFDRQENPASGSITPVANQARTFVDPVPIIITGNNIIVSSIVVRDATGLILYTAGADYTVQVFTDNVQITRVIGGRIANGQTVLISYNLSPQPANTVTNNTIAGSIRYDFERGPLHGLGVYARYTNLDQSIESARPAAFVPNSLKDTTVGAEYRVWEIVTGAEEEWHHSDINPYDATRLFARFQHRLPQNTTMQLAANYSMFHYTQEHNEINMLTVTGTAGHSFTNTLYGSVSATYLNQDDQNFGVTQGIEGTAEVRWTYRQTTVYAQVRQSFLNTEVQKSSFQSAYVGIRREF